MLEKALAYLEEKHTCPHCNTELSLCHAPPMHVGDGLGWGSEFLFICLNNECSLFIKGWEYIETQYGHVGSYRYMEIPNSKESYNMMVAGQSAFTGSVVDVEALKRQNARYKSEKEAVAKLDTCVEARDLGPVLFLLTDNAAKIDDRKRAVSLLTAINDLSCIEVLRNHDFSNTQLEQDINLAINKILANHFLRECPYCAELIKSRAKVCKHCSKEVE